ncbi:hypothetical protein LR48_Vigan10g118300 [Vigna angularis]|uniref:Uncharacterized protein n=1 Tax=Phaseolus angularis TaxID=3914 RepID=A0A0L9VJR3_PHAAN|nr:hypothetical protein LR48_Vigan10g118300 [Vigna angularis]
MGLSKFRMSVIKSMGLRRWRRWLEKVEKETREGGREGVYVEGQIKPKVKR